MASLDGGRLSAAKITEIEQAMRLPFPPNVEDLRAMIIALLAHIDVIEADVAALRAVLKMAASSYDDHHYDCVVGREPYECDCDFTEMREQAVKALDRTKWAEARQEGGRKASDD